VPPKADRRSWPRSRRTPPSSRGDEWVYELLDLIEETKATRVVVDSLGDLLLASPDPIRFRELLHSLVQRCARQSVSLLFTLEVAELFDSTRISDVGVSHLSDNVVVLQYHRVGSEVKRSLTVLKTRASDHTPSIRDYHIGSSGSTSAPPRFPGAEVSDRPQVDISSATRRQPRTHTVVRVPQTLEHPRVDPHPGRRARPV
jgi:KaiC/GvpD/RAD55 family RecA-like ATPase